MGRVVKIIIYAFVILALWFWFSSIFKSCNSTTADDTVTVALDDAVGDDTEYVEDDFFADEVADSETETISDDEFEDDTNTADVADDEEDEIDYSSIDDELENKPASRPAPRNNTTPARPQNNVSSNTNSNGRYLVIAGSYLVEGNANKMRSKLNNLGYTSEVIVFDLSEFHSVCAGRYSDYDDALNVSSRLKQQGIDNYVHTRKR